MHDTKNTCGTIRILKAEGLWKTKASAILKLIVAGEIEEANHEMRS